VAGLAAGLAAATKYSGGLAILFPLAAWIIAARDRARTGRSRPLLPWACLGACVACAAAGFVVGCPYALLAPHEWWGSIDTFQGVSYELHHMKVGEHPAVEVWPNGYAFHLLASLAYGLGWPLLIALLAAFAYACYRRANGDWLLVPFILVWYLMIGAAKVRYMRYAMPLVPMLAVLGGRLCSDVALMRRPAARTRWLRSGVPLVVCVLVLVAEMAALLQAVAYSGPGASRPALLRRAGVAAGDSVGLIWAPWFPHPPVAYVNGGAVLNRHPVWREFARSPYDVRVMGYAPDEADLPEFLVTTRFEVRDARKAGTADWRSIDGALREHYHLVAEEQLGPRWLGRFGPPLEDAPADWLYPFPGIRVYRLLPRQEAGQPAEAAWDGTGKDSRGR
jgi:4-amino-4-deoxy-L-arabinose transferase-like glycosyltransferase